MRKQYTLLLSAFIALLLPAFHASAALSDYGFTTSGKGEYIDISDAPSILLPGDDDVTSNVQNFGFTFYFDGQPYSQYTVSSNGLIGLGATKVSPCWLNSLTTANGLCDGSSGFDYTGGSVPQIAAYWDDCRVPDMFDDGFEGTVRAETIGTAPNRITVIEFNNVETSYYDYEYSTWQIRLYEGSNKIEFYYDYLNPNYFNNGATIGMSVDPGNFVTVTPQEGGTADVRSFKPNDFYYPYDPEIPSGTLYTFSPCQLIITGDVSQGGTELMAPGDDLLTGMQVNLGQSQDFYPFSINLDGGCPQGNYTAAIGGPNAGDYSIDPNPGTVYPGEGIWPTITFKPSATGVRSATLTLTDDKGRSVEYNLKGIGLTRIKWTGDPSQGGTDEMKSGDILMTAIHVARGESGSFNPFTLTNISENQEDKPVPVSFYIKGISGGQYSITPSDGSIAAGKSMSPTITFTPTGVGPVRDSLFATADGETRAFELLAISDAAGAEFYINGELIDPSSTVFTNQYGCVGSNPITLPFDVKNIGNQDFTINHVDFFATDTNFAQGTPRYALLRDEMGNPIHSYDYIITTTPPVAPYSASQQALPIVVPQGSTTRLYFTLISQLPGKRFARAFIYTNGETEVGTDPNGEMIEGLVSFDLFGRGLGSQLSDNPNGGLPKGVVLPLVGVGASSDGTLNMFNTGTCDLRISMKSFKFTSGDIGEFTVTSIPSAPANTIDEATGDLVLAPGASASVGVRFTPSQTGSRRATMRLETNDSTIQLPGLTERGSYYVDFYGGGANGLYGGSISFGTALMGGTGADEMHGKVTARNVSSAPIVINAITIEGTDASEFTQDAAAAWPATPFVINPNSSVDLGVLFAPAAGGVVGQRSATLKLVTANGDILTNSLDGIAGTRTIAVSPGTLNFAVSSGKTTRKTIMIVNTGSMPLTLAAPVLTGSTEISIGALPRTVLAPGQSEFLEVTFMPTSTATNSATLTFGSNATGGPVVVTINTSASKTHFAGDPDQSATTGGNQGGNQIGRGGEFSSTLGVETETSSNGVTLRQSVPNPARDVVEIGYRLAQHGDVELSLYDASGRLVRTLVGGVRDAGDQTVRVDLSSLASGVYHYRLIANGQTLSRTLTVVK